MIGKHLSLAPALLGWLVTGCAASDLAAPLSPSPAVEPGLVIAEEIASTGELSSSIEEAPAEPVAPPPPPRPDPEALLGLEPGAVQGLLGVPSLVRNDGNAQIHQFTGPECVFDVVFYEPLPGAAFEARHVEARALDGARADAIVCIQTFLPDGLWPEGSGLATLAGGDQS